MRIGVFHPNQRPDQGRVKTDALHPGFVAEPCEQPAFCQQYSTYTDRISYRKFSPEGRRAHAWEPHLPDAVTYTAKTESKTEAAGAKEPCVSAKTNYL
jgi:hypothetical protein